MKKIELTFDEIIEERWIARSAKDYRAADALRNFLDDNLIFCFDHADWQEVFYLTENYFAKKPSSITHRQWVEHCIRRDRKAEAFLNSWIYSNTIKKQNL